MPLFNDLQRKQLLYLGLCVNAFSVFKHTEISVNNIFPFLDKSPNLPPAAVLGAKNCLLLASVYWGAIG